MVAMKFHGTVPEPVTMRPIVSSELNAFGPNKNQMIRVPATGDSHMTRKERKEFLQAIGFWKDFLTIREKLTQEGLSHAQASEEAMREIREMKMQTPRQQKLAMPTGDEWFKETDDPLLQAMTFVIEQEPACDHTEMHRRLRIWKEEDVGGFMGLWSDLHYRAQRKKLGIKEERPENRDDERQKEKRRRFAGLRKIQKKLIPKEAKTGRGIC